jgi:hypothetical protein
MHPMSAFTFIKHTLKDLKITCRSQHSGSGRYPSITNRKVIQTINKEILELNETIDQIDLIDVYGIFHHATAQCIFFSAAYGTFSKIHRNLRHIASFNNIRKLK